MLSYVITSTSKNNYKTYVQYIEDVRQPHSYHDKSPQSVVQIVPSSGVRTLDCFLSQYQSISDYCFYAGITRSKLITIARPTLKIHPNSSTRVENGR